MLENHEIPWFKPWHSLPCWLDTIRGDHKRSSANISLTSPSFQRLSQCSLKKHVFSWVFCPDRGSSKKGGTPHCPRQRKQPDARNWLGTRFCVAVWEITLFETIWYMAMDQYLLIPFLGGWTSIYQLFWCSPGVQGFDPHPYGKVLDLNSSFFAIVLSMKQWINGTQLPSRFVRLKSSQRSQWLIIISHQKRNGPKKEHPKR